MPGEVEGTKRMRGRQAAAPAGRCCRFVFIRGLCAPYVKRLKRTAEAACLSGKFRSVRRSLRLIHGMFRKIRPVEFVFHGTDLAFHGMFPHENTLRKVPYCGKNRVF